MTERTRKIKARLRDRFFRTKWLVVLIVAAVILFFGRATDIRSLNQSALVIGMGIDLSEEGFDVSTLSVVVSGGGGSETSRSYAVHTATGATISECLDEISQKMGLIVSLSHCNVLVLSPETFSVRHGDIFDPLISVYSLPEQAVVTATEEEPSDVLGAKTATTDASAFLMQSALLQNLGGDGLAPVSVKDFMAHSLSRSGCVNIPLIELKDPARPPETEQGPEKGVKELAMERNLVVHGGKCFVLEKELAQATTMLVRKKVYGRISVILDTGEAAEFRVLDASPETKASGMSVHASLNCTVSLLEVQGGDGERVSPTSDVVSRAAKKAEEELAERLALCHEISLREGADLLHLQEAVYRVTGYTLPEDCLDDIAFSCSVKVSVKEEG